jgi:hypothetical protein
MSDEEWRLLYDMEQAVLMQDEPRLKLFIAQACLLDTQEEIEPDRLETIRRGAYWQMEPCMKEALFDFGDRDFFRRGVDCFMDMSRKRYTRSAPLYLWTNRLTLAGRAVCYRLKGRCEYGKIREQESAGLQSYIK